MRSRFSRQQKVYLPVIGGMLCLLALAGTSTTAATLCDYCSQIGRACNITLGQCVPCTPTSGCTERQVCNTNTGICAVKDLFHPFLWSDGVLIVLVFLATGLSNAGGIGGGILLVPLLSLFAGFTLKNASANAQPLIFGASIANAMVNVPRRHAARDTPRIDWNLVACTVPFFLMGTTPGTFMNQAFPSYFTAFVLALLLSVLSVQSALFGLRLLRERLQERHKNAADEQTWKAEAAGNAADDTLSSRVSSPSVAETAIPVQSNGVDDCGRDAANATKPSADRASAERPDSSDPHLNHESRGNGCCSAANANNAVDSSDVHATGSETAASSPSNNVHPLRPGRSRFLCYLDPLLCAQSREELLAAERPWFQWRYMLFLLACWLVLFIIQILSGSAEKHSPVGAPLCGAVYWILFAIQESVLFAMGCFTIWRNLSLNRLRDRLGYPWYSKNGLGDIRWTRALIFGYPVWAFIAGVFGSWVGIGGSSLLIPFLNLVGRADPATVQSSMSLSNLLGSASGAFVYLAQGRLNISYGLFFGLFALLGSYTGVWMVYFLVERYQIRALFVFALTICFVTALGAILYIAIRNTLGVEAAGVGWVFTNICAYVG
jgi:uncharacterized membrane protein YfcA